MELVQTITVGSGGASSIVFANIPQDASDLLFQISVRSSTTGSSVENCLVSFNSNSSDYSHRELNGDGSTATTQAGTSRLAFRAPRAGTTANTFGNTNFYIPNYRSSLTKVYVSDSVTENNSTEAHQTIIGGHWSNTAAITSTTFSPSTNNFVSGSVISLYKITKGSGGATPS